MATVGAVGFNADADRLQGTDLPSDRISYTLAFWYKPVDRTNTGTLLRLIDTFGGVHSINIDTGGTLKLYDTFGFSTSVRTLTNGTWYFIATTVDASLNRTVWCAAEGETTLGSVTYAGYTADMPWVSLQICGDPEFGDGIDGAACLVRVWNRELSEAELLAEMASATPVSATNLIGSYPLASVATKLTASVGTALTEPVAGGAWTDEVGPNFGATSIALDAAISATATVAADLTTQIAMAASLSATAAVAGDLTTSIPLAASVSATATTAADLLTQIALAASINSTAGIVGDLTTAIPLAGSVSGTAAVVASLTTAIPLQAAVAATATVTGSLAGIAAALEASVLASATASGDLTTAIPLAASIAASGSVSVDLTTAIPLAASVGATAAAVADLTTAISLAAAISATATISGDLVVPNLLYGTASAAATATGDLTTAISLAAAITARATITAAFKPLTEADYFHPRAPRPPRALNTQLLGLPIRPTWRRRG